MREIVAALSAYLCLAYLILMVRVVYLGSSLTYSKKKVARAKLLFIIAPLAFPICLFYSLPKFLYKIIIELLIEAELLNKKKEIVEIKQEVKKESVFCDECKKKIIRGPHR